MPGHLRGPRGPIPTFLSLAPSCPSAVRGYEVIVRTGPDGTLHLTCPELPQLSVSSPTVTEAISRTEDAINAILAGHVAASRIQSPREHEPGHHGSADPGRGLHRSASYDFHRGLAQRPSMAAIRARCSSRGRSTVWVTGETIEHAISFTSPIRHRRVRPGPRATADLPPHKV